MLTCRRKSISMSDLVADDSLADVRAKSVPAVECVSMHEVATWAPLQHSSHPFFIPTRQPSKACAFFVDGRILRWQSHLATCKHVPPFPVARLSCLPILLPSLFPGFQHSSRGRHTQSHAFRFQLGAYHFDGISVVEGR